MSGENEHEKSVVLVSLPEITDPRTNPFLVNPYFRYHMAKLSEGVRDGIPSAGSEGCAKSCGDHWFEPKDEDERSKKDTPPLKETGFQLVLPSPDYPTLTMQVPPGVLLANWESDNELALRVANRELSERLIGEFGAKVEEYFRLCHGVRPFEFFFQENEYGGKDFVFSFLKTVELFGLRIGVPMFTEMDIKGSFFHLSFAAARKQVIWRRVEKIIKYLEAHEMYVDHSVTENRRGGLDIIFEVKRRFPIIRSPEEDK